MASFDLRRALEAKALGPHPAFMSSDPVSVYSPGAARQDAVISQREASRHLDAYGGSQAIDNVYDCIGLYVDAVASSPYRLEKPDGTKLVRSKTKGTPPDHQIGPVEVYDLLDKPNPHMLWDELVSLFIIDWMLVGNAYWFKLTNGPSGKPLELYRLAPSHVKIIPGQFGPKRYEYQPPGVREKLLIDPSAIVHFRRPNPHSAFYGMGIIQGAGRAMDMELAITDTVTSYYENRADPSLVVSSERRVSRDVFNKLRAQMRARVSGSRKAGELLVLEAGLKADTLSVSASEALFDKLSQMSRDRVFQKFHVSPKLLGLTTTDAANKVSDVRREFDNYTLRPFISKVQAKLTAALLEPYDVQLVIDYAQMLPPDEAIKVGESVAKIPGVKIREVRKQYAQFGIEESTGDSDLDEELLNLPLGDLGPDGQPLDPSVASGADKPLSSEAGRPPKPSNTSSIGNAAGKALEDADTRLYTPLTGHGWTRDYRDRRRAELIAQKRERGEIRSFGEVSAVLAMKALEEAVSKAEGKGHPSTPAPDNRLPGERRPDDTFAAARKSDIDGVTASIATDLRAAVVELERGLLDTVEGKALKSSDMVARIKRSPAWKTFETRLRAILADGTAQAAASGVMHSGLTPDEEIDYDEIAADIIGRPDGVRGIIKTLKQRYANRIKEARDNNAERADFEAAVRAVTTEWADGQAVAIADSEATEAYNEGTLTATELSGVKQVYVIEEPDAPDQECQDARGSVWEVAFARQNRKQHPRCRRAFIPLTDAAVA